jgi:hypothetical protein
MWSIIKRETGYATHKDEPQSLKINNTIIKVKKHIANIYTKYFTSVAWTIVGDLNKDHNKTPTNINLLHYLNNKYMSTFKPIKWHYASTTAI